LEGWFARNGIWACYVCKSGRLDFSLEVSVFKRWFGIAVFIPEVHTFLIHLFGLIAFNFCFLRRSNACWNSLDRICFFP